MNGNNQKIFGQKGFTGLIFMVFVGLVLTLLFNDTLIIDELEHLRASRFVSEGKMPYRDFFEHHHPLIWFMYAPLINLLPQSNLIVLYVAKLLAFIFSLGSCFIIFQTVKRFLGGNLSAVLALAFYFFYFVCWYGFSLFKPDTFMRFFYLLGLYEFFAFCEKQQTKNLIACGIAFVTAFLFLQTSVFSILPLLFPLLWLLRQKKIHLSQLIIAAVPTLLFLLCLVGGMLVTDMWTPYLELNWIYNRYLFGILFSQSSSVIYRFLPLILLATAMLCLLYKTNRVNFYVHTLALLFVSEFVQHLIFPAVYPHYLILLFLFSSLICGYAFSFCSQKTMKILLAVLFVNTILNYAVIAITNNASSHAYLSEYDKAPTAGMVNFDVTYFSVFAPQYSYYWFYPNLEYIDNKLFNRLPDYDINNIIRQENPEYIAYNSAVKQHFDFSKAKKHFDLHECRKRHVLQTELLRDYEEIMPDLYKRRDNYR